MSQHNKPYQNPNHPSHPNPSTEPDSILATAEIIQDPEHDRHKGPHVKGPHDLKEINPKMSSDIAYWANEFHVTGQQLHEAIRSHGTHVDKVRAALQSHKTA
jgi:hypothetical protein